ncbi:MAG: sigma-54 dependent transcriptional regulator [Pseudomonadota bacterium]
MSTYKARAVKNAKVLIVDDEPSIVDFIATTLSANGYAVEAYCDPLVALKNIKGRIFDLAMVDINMPEMNGIEFSKKLLEISLSTEVVIITGVPDEENLDPCLRMGLTHFLFKPFNESQLVYTVYAALHFKRLRNAFVASSSSERKGSGYIGVSMSTRDIREEVASLAGLDIPVLILGKSGTGKEIIARDIHRNSSRSQSVFMPINCAVLGSLAETELFGHVSGAFTGAVKSTKGYIGTADGGTLFFDEVGELPLEVQVKLLRFLDDGEYSKVGEAKIHRVDVRIVAATNRDIEAMCRSGQFREDLYYRLSASIIKTTPLDERKADILPLIWHFLDLFGTAKNITYEISADAASQLIERNWPGNVRQLKQTLYKISQMATSRKIALTDVRRVIGESKQESVSSYKEAKELVLEEFDRDYLMKTLCLSQGSLQQALKLSGMHKKNFYAKIKELGLAMKDFSSLQTQQK